MINKTVTKNITLPLFATSIMILALAPYACAQPYENIIVKTNGLVFDQGEPLSIIAMAHVNGKQPVTIDEFKSEAATIVGPCGLDYLNIAMIKGAHQNIKTYDELLALKDQYVNFEYKDSNTKLPCKGIDHQSVALVELSVLKTVPVAPDAVAKLTPKMKEGFFDNKTPQSVHSDAVIQFNDSEGKIQEVAIPLLYAKHDIVEYYDTDVRREPVEPSEGSQAETKVYRRNYDLSLGQYTIVGSTMSGSISEPVIIIIQSSDLSTSSVDTNVLYLLFGIIASGGILALYGINGKNVFSNATKAASHNLRKISFAIVLMGIFSVLTVPVAESEASWDEGAQGIKVQSTGTSFNVAAVQSDFFGVDFGGSGSSKGVSVQNNAFIDGQTIGTNYLWSQALTEAKATTSTTYTSYTYDTQSGTYTCKYPSEVEVKGALQFTTDEGSWPFYCPSGWTRNTGLDCYLIVDESNEIIKDVGDASKKRFDLYAYKTLSTGKINAVLKFRTCTDDTSGCGSYATLKDITSGTVAGSNEEFISDSVEGTTYYPSSALVGWEGGSTFRPLTGTYVEHSYTIDSSGTES